MQGIRCNVLAYDLAFDQKFASTYGVKSTDIDSLCTQLDIITLHVPLNEQTKYLNNGERIRSIGLGDKYQ
jgi:D-lactate dehydrogenase